VELHECKGEKEGGGKENWMLIRGGPAGPGYPCPRGGQGSGARGGCGERLRGGGGDSTEAYTPPRFGEVGKKGIQLQSAYQERGGRKKNVNIFTCPNHKKERLRGGIFGCTREHKKPPSPSPTLEQSKEEKLN